MRSRFLLVAALLAWLIVGSARPPAASSSRPVVAAWMPTSWDAERARASFRAHSDRIDELSPFWYALRADGGLRPYQGARDRTLLEEARAGGARVLPTISNEFSPQPVHAILLDPNLRRDHIGAILAEVLAYDYDGIDIDYENLYAADRAAYSHFLAELAAALHARGKWLSVDLHAKRSENGTWNGPASHDYAAIGAVADEVRIMAYGWCWATGCSAGEPPGPIAPVHWLEDVLTFAVSRIEREKIMLGVHLYGYDWPLVRTGSTILAAPARPALNPARSFALSTLSGGQALTWEEAEALRQARGAELRWWEEEERGLVQEPWFAYEGHGVTFANARSVAARWRLAQAWGLRGVAFWRLGGEDPALWPRLGASGRRVYLPMVSGGAP